MVDRALRSMAGRAEEQMRSVAESVGKLPAAVSVARFVANYGAVGDMQHYRYVPAVARNAVARVQSDMGLDAGRAFLRMAIGQGILDLCNGGRLRRLPPRIVEHHVKQLDRITDAMDEDGDWLDLESDLFLKDFGLVTLRLLAAAAQLLDVRCGVPRSIVLKQGASRIPHTIWTMIRSGGFKPWVQIHTHLRNLDDFNEQGWNECYRCCADLFQLEPNLLGMFGSSWFYDPVVDVVSPRLGYLRKVPLSGGAHLFFMERGGEAIANAVATLQPAESSTRMESTCQRAIC